MSANRGQSMFRQARRISEGKQSETVTRKSYQVGGGGRGMRLTQCIYLPKRTKVKGWQKQNSTCTFNQNQ